MSNRDEEAATEQLERMYEDDVSNEPFIPPAPNKQTSVYSTLTCQHAGDSHITCQTEDVARGRGLLPHVYRVSGARASGK